MFFLLLCEILFQRSKKNYEPKEKQMKRLWYFVAVSFLYFSVTLVAVARENPRVVFVGVDGLGGYYLPQAKTPHIDSLKESGTFTYEMQNVIHPVSSPNWMSMITGSGPSQHGVLDNDWKRGDTAVPKTIFRVIKEQRPHFLTAFFYQWSGLRRLIEPGVFDMEENGKDAEETMQLALDALHLDPDFTFIHLDLVDAAGHKHGWGSRKYIEAVEATDKLIGRLIQHLQELGSYEQTIIMLSSDHGGDRSHNKDNYQTRSIPFVISGPNVIANQELRLQSRIWDIAPTLAQVWQLDRPASWIGSPVWEAFEDTQDEIKLHYKPRLKVLEQEQYEWVYADYGTGARRDLSVWKPMTHSGFVRLGHVAQGSHDIPDYPTIIVEDDDRVLSSPLAWERIASDKRSSGKYDVIFWRAVPKRGYICIGDVAHLGYTLRPPLDEIKCIHHSYVIANQAQYTWDSKGSLSKDQITVWSNQRSNMLGIAPNSMLVRRIRGSLGYNLSFAVKRSKLKLL